MTEITEKVIDRWLERGSRFFKTVSRNPVVRDTLLARGLTDEELSRGWKLYTELHGFGAEAPARPATRETAAAQAINEIDSWDGPAFGAARAVLDARFPEVRTFLFDNLEAGVGTEAVAGVARFLKRLMALRDGNVSAVDPERGRAAVQLLATRKIIDSQREGELQALIQTATSGARPDEVVAAPALNPQRVEVAQAYITWLNEWREIARVAISRRDYRIFLGLAQRRQSGEGDEDAGEGEAIPE